MDLKQLKYFVAVAELENFGRAAAELRIAQPALSRQVALLEKELGIQLFVRHTRGVVLAESAKLLLERARFILRFVEQTKNDVVALQSAASGPVVLGLHSSLAVRLGPQLLKACLTEFPNVRLGIIEATSPTLTNLLLDGHVDLAILNAPQDTTRITVEPLLNEKIYLIGPPAPIFEQHAPLAPHALASLPMILAGFSRSGIRVIVESAVIDDGARLNLIAEVDSPLATAEMVLEKLGYTANLLGTFAQYMRDGRLVSRPIGDLHVVRVIARLRDRPQSRASQELARLIKNVVGDAIVQNSWPGASPASGADS